MLDDPRLQKLFSQVIGGKVSARHLVEFRTEPSVDAAGQDALRVTLVLTELGARELTGDQVSSLLIELHDSLVREGDERFPVLHFATVADLQDTGEDDD